MLQQLRCPRCGKRVCDHEPDSVIEIPCRHCKAFIRYDKGTITTGEVKAKQISYVRFPKELLSQKTLMNKE